VATVTAVRTVRSFVNFIGQVSPIK
jgi:hypothetical protein